MKRVLSRMLDEKEFLSPYGIRALSRVYGEHPYVFELGGQQFSIDYQPAESKTAMFGGNSNWRGPIWMPANVVLLRALLQIYVYYRDNFTIECPTGSGNRMNLFEVAKEISTRLNESLDETGRRPVYGGMEKFQTDPNWKASGSTNTSMVTTAPVWGLATRPGWTGLIAKLIDLFGCSYSAQFLAVGKRAAFMNEESARDRDT